VLPNCLVFSQISKNSVAPNLVINPQSSIASPCLVSGQDTVSAALLIPADDVNTQFGCPACSGQWWSPALLSILTWLCVQGWVYVMTTLFASHSHHCSLKNVQSGKSHMGLAESWLESITSFLGLIISLCIIQNSDF
jgi:hypothetical protein